MEFRNFYLNSDSNESNVSWFYKRQEQPIWFPRGFLLLALFLIALKVIDQQTEHQFSLWYLSPYSLSGTILTCVSIWFVDTFDKICLIPRGYTKCARTLIASILMNIFSFFWILNLMSVFEYFVAEIVKAVEEKS